MQINGDTIRDFVSENKWVKTVLIGVVGVGAMIFVAQSMFAEDLAPRVDPATIEQRSYLGLDEELENIDHQEAANIVDEMRVRLEDRERSLVERYQAEASSIEQMQMEQQQLQNQVFELERIIRQQNNQPQQVGMNGANMDPSQRQPREYQVQGDPVRYQSDEGPGVLRRPQTEIVTESPQIEGNVIRTITQRNIREVQRSGEMTVSDIKVQRLTEDGQAVDDTRASSQQASNERNPSSRGDNGEFTLTMGSLISGTLINGVAAPTRVGSSETPVPILMRIKREAIMPNSFTLDIRECMMLGSAIGDLASERVMVRAEGISCITEDGQALEQDINAYAVSSSDGLTGIRGTVVERSGKAIMNSVKAGFLSGFSEAAAPQQVSSLNTNPSATQAWQSQNLNQYTGAGMLKGASNAMERVASYYLAIADAMWPVIEVPAGIEVDFIVQRGMTLQLNPVEEMVEE
jgi:conjugal transfer pilus assembly protein TraB